MCRSSEIRWVHLSPVQLPALRARECRVSAFHVIPRYDSSKRTLTDEDLLSRDPED